MQKPNILIVDDVSINRELLSYILRDQYQIYEAENGAQAIEMIESQERLYHLVLLDIRRRIHLQAEAAQQLALHHKVDLAVIHEQHGHRTAHCRGGKRPPN